MLPYVKKFIKEHILNLSLLLTLPLLSIFYNRLNHMTTKVHLLETSFDRLVPFLKIFILPYAILQIYILLLLLYFYWQDRSMYYKSLLSINIGLIFCYSIYYLFQTTVPRPMLSNNDFLTAIVKFTYNIDHPFNTFPSIHTLTSYIMIKSINMSRVKNKINSTIIYFISLLIILSTQFVKQHVLVDALAAIILGELVFDTVNKLFKLDIVFWFRKQLSFNLQRELQR